MGYTAHYFQHAVQLWFDRGWLKPQQGQRLIEFGAQEFFADDLAEVHHEVGGFLTRHGASEAAIETVLGNSLPKVDAIYAAMGIDYLSIDTEGSEYEILSNFNFDKYQIKIVTCEHNFTPAREKIFSLMTQKRYLRRFAKFSRFDDWYVRAD